MNRLHHNADTEAYKNRIEAINYSLAHDGGQSNRNLAEAGDHSRWDISGR